MGLNGQRRIQRKLRDSLNIWRMFLHHSHYKLIFSRSKFCSMILTMIDDNISSNCFIQPLSLLISNPQRRFSVPMKLLFKSISGTVNKPIGYLRWFKCTPPPPVHREISIIIGPFVMFWYSHLRLLLMEFRSFNINMFRAALKISHGLIHIREFMSIPLVRCLGDCRTVINIIFR